MEKKVHYIRVIPRWTEKRKVGIYCRVSTNDMEQINSLRAQISAPTRMVSNVEQWKLVDVMLSNEKYTGNVRLLDSVTGEVEYLAKENNPPIISDKDFKAVQEEKNRRSNVVADEHGFKRKGTKYSSRNIYEKDDN